MGKLQGFSTLGQKSKIISDSVKIGTVGDIGLSAKGNSVKTNVSFKSGTKAATMPTKVGK